MTNGGDYGGGGGGVTNTSSLNIAGIGSGLGSLFTAESDLEAASGSTAAGNAYTAGAAIAGQNELLAAESGTLEQIAAARKVRETIAKQQNAIASNGFNAGSGTGLSLLRESTAQGAQTGQVIGLQTQINENAYTQQEEALQGEASQAYATAASQQAAAAGSAISGVAGLVGSLFKLF